jgi:hypothetical protein
MQRIYADGKCIDEVPDDDDYDPPAWKNTNCRNCGAPLTRGQIKCEYCGTSRQIKSEIVINASEMRFMCY